MRNSTPVEPVISVIKKDEIPSHWDLNPIGDICASVDKVNPKENPTNGFKYIDISGIDNERFKVAETKAYYGNNAPSRARQLVREGDIVFSTVRTYLKNMARITRELDGEVASTGFCVIRPKAPEYSSYLYYYLQYEPFLNELAKFQRGTSYPAVRDGDVFAQFIPVPPKHEVVRIVSEIEKQFSRLDEAVANLKRVKANLKRYKGAVLKAAVEGCLVETEAELARRKGCTYETGVQLLKRILETRRNLGKEQGKYKETAGPEIIDLPEVSEGWVWATASQVLSEVKDGTHETPEYQPIGVPFITQKHVKSAGFVFDDYKLISHEEHQHFYKRSNPKRGDILVSMIGVNRGESCIVDTDDIFSIKNVGLLKPDNKLNDAKYLQYYMSSLWGQKLLLRRSKGGAQPFVGLAELRSWPIALPPLVEQHRIAAEVDRRFSLVHEVEAQVDANLLRAARLRQCILEMAFSGKLYQ